MGKKATKKTEEVSTDSLVTVTFSRHYNDNGKRYNRGESHSVSSDYADFLVSIGVI